MEASELTVHNYHSLDSNRSFYSSHLWGMFMDCPARAVAYLNGTWKTGPKVAFLYGAYVDVSILTPVDLPAWCQENLADMIEMGMLKKGKATMGQKAAIMERADVLIEHAKLNAEFMNTVTGDNQRILTAEIGGKMWRMMCDCIDIPEKRICDLKTSEDMGKTLAITRDTIFDRLDGTYGQFMGRGNFIRIYKYNRQMAIYREIAARSSGTCPEDWETSLSVLQKKKPADPNPDLPDHRTVVSKNFKFRNSDELTDEIRFIEEHIDQVDAWKTGAEPPPMCNDPECAYCTAYGSDFYQDANSGSDY